MPNVVIAGWDAKDDRFLMFLVNVRVPCRSKAINYSASMTVTEIDQIRLKVCTGMVFNTNGYSICCDVFQQICWQFLLYVLFEAVGHGVLK